MDVSSSGRAGKTGSISGLLDVSGSGGVIAKGETGSDWELAVVEAATDCDRGHGQVVAWNGSAVGIVAVVATVATCSVVVHC